jgi:uncharacterized protein YdcH (DUF465 family)
VQETLVAPYRHRLACLRHSHDHSNRSINELIKVAESSQVDEMLAQRAALLDEASSLIVAASVDGRDLTAGEDSHVLRLMKRVQTLDEEVAPLKRHEAAKDPTES